MANAIELVTKQLPMIDQLVKRSLLTGNLELNSAFVRETQNAEIVQIANIALEGLGDYSREEGFVQGDITLTWEPYRLKHDRGRTFHLDAMDDEESLALIFANLATVFVREKVVPEVDAIRFATYASNAGIKKTGTLDSTTIDDAIIDAEVEVEENEFLLETAKLYITPTLYGDIKKNKDSFSRPLVPSQNPNRNFGTYDDMEVTKVPQSRFYTAIELRNGTGTQKTGGYAKGAAGKNINFMIILPQCVIQITKHAKLRVFEPDVNQKADAYKVDYRLYHDAWVLKNKTNGVYCHHEA